MFDKTISEGERQKQIILYVNSYTKNFVWRNNTGQWKIVSRYKTKQGFKEVESWLHNGVAGSPDLVGFTPEGKFIGIEIKRAGKKLEPDQILFAKRLRDAGGVYIAAREIEDIQEKLQGIKHEPLPF